VDVGQEQLAERVSQAVLRFIAAVVLHNQAVAARVGLGASDAQVLSLLTVNGPMTPSQIASLTGLTTGSVTALLDRLERGDYVRRERDTKDRRKILVVPEEEGQQRLAQHYAGYGEHMQRVLARLTPRELQTIAEFLDAMNDVDAGYIAEPPAGPTQSRPDQGPAG
jgi:DNA-binding MarR family transcriptional regulator